MAALSVVNLRSGMNASTPLAAQRSATADTYARVCRHATAYGHGAHAGGVDCLGEFVDEYIDDSALERCCKVGEVVLDEVGVGLDAVAQGVEKRSLKSRKRVVEAGNMRFCKLKLRSVALGGETVDVRSAGVGQAHYFGAFVECFACGVVDGAAENLHVVCSLVRGLSASCHRIQAGTGKGTRAHGRRRSALRIVPARGRGGG